MPKKKISKKYLEVEKLWVFIVLMCVSGFYGAYTYCIRGGVFSNAQTANLVLFSMAIGSGDWSRAAYLLIPMSAYLLGAIISEYVYEPMRKLKLIHWETLLIFIEIGAVIFLGLLPESAPYEIAQVTINFISSMRLNTFRRAQEIPMATTFCTNHIRQLGNNIVHFVRYKDKRYFKVSLVHFKMLFAFIVGGIFGTILSAKYLGRSIFITLIPLTIVFIRLLIVDLKTEKDDFDIVPGGH
ncbi:DUF1275 domain-containing protein [Anaerosphaera multitolerans]|uniref:DUF1275 domain-containing protein n=2 Tax=Anaerosphaera multitolerans TaxID=2487351 RepID=A0A437S9S5_9FIRM|nr:DUF1275 domain-containing protein [Anaerosphaera multitolerans]